MFQSLTYLPEHTTFDKRLHQILGATDHANCVKRIGLPILPEGISED